MWRFAGGRLARAARSLRRRGQAACGTFIVDRQGTILGFDDSMEELTGWPAVEVVGNHKERPRPSGFQSATPASPLYEGSLPVPSQPQTVELRLNGRDGSRLLVEALVTLLPGRGERLSVQVLRLVSRWAASSSATGLAGRDALTGLYDGESFARHLTRAFQEAVDSGRTLAVLLADVDHLRQVNDRLGRAAGDRVLRQLAGIIRAAVDDDACIARIDHDDFAILLPGSGRGEARQTAARLRSIVDRFQFFDGAREATITLSLGAASFPADAETPNDLMRRAVDALNQAREFGRNRAWCYTRRPRVPLEVPVYFDAAESLLVGFTRDLSPSGLFVQTSAPVEMGMRCALTFGLPTHQGKLHVVGRVVRTVPAPAGSAAELRIPGMGIEFEKFGDEDRRAIESYLHRYESLTRRPETGIQSS